MVHPFFRHLHNPGLNAGPYPVKAPSQPVRGYDAPQRDALYIAMGASKPVEGNGYVCGGYERQSPAFFNVQPRAIISDVSGSGLGAGAAQRAGGLINIAALSNFLKGA